jgi:hypothetical protein
VLKDEILEAVALAIAELRKDHAAAISVVRAEMEAAHQKALEADAQAREAVLARILETNALLEQAIATQMARADADADSRAALERAIAERATPEQITEALMPIQTAQEAQEQALAALATPGYVDAALAPVRGAMSALEEAVANDFRDVRATLEDFDRNSTKLVTLDEVKDALLPLQAALNAQEQVIATQLARVDVEADSRVADSHVALERAIATRATPEQIADALAPLQAALDAQERAIATRAAPEQILDALAPVGAAIAELQDIWKTHDKVFMEEGLFVRSALDAAEAAIAARAAPEQITEALVPLQAALEAQERALATRVTPEHVVAALAPLQAALEAQEQAIATRATPEQVTEALAPVQAALRVQIDEAASATVSRLKDLMVERYTAAEAWARGGPSYQAFALVTHNGGLWQAVCRASDEPGASAEWVLLSDGLASLAFEDGAETPELVARMVSGRVQRWPVRLPVPVFRGVYDPEEVYQAWDTVAKDGHVFLRLRAGPAAAPGEVPGEWQVFSGPKGRKGRDAPRADEDALVQRISSDVLHQIVPQLQGAVDQMMRGAA